MANNSTWFMLSKMWLGTVIARGGIKHLISEGVIFPQQELPQIGTPSPAPGGRLNKCLTAIRHVSSHIECLTMMPAVFGETAVFAPGVQSPDFRAT
jgi:hypothetical protein